MATCPTCQQDFEQSAFCPRDGTRLVGEQVLDGRYRLFGKVGEGAMGEVFQGEHIHLHRRVAVKILRRHIAYQPEAIARLEREAQATSQLGHPNIVNVLDFGRTDDGSVYLVMEWLDGEDLDAYLSRSAVDLATALAIVTQAAAGIAEAHDHGVIHRDLKPANLFITRDRAGALRVKILDFGIAKLAIEQTQLTGTGVLIGTPNYMAPEQALGDPTDARSDIYALGVILYELLTGVVPFQGDSPIAVLHQHTSRLPVVPSTVARDRGITADVDLIVMRCLEKRPADRFATGHDLIAAIQAARLHPEPVTAPPPMVLDAADGDDELLASAGIRRRSPLLIAVAVVTLGGLGVLAAVLLMAGGDSDRSATPVDAAAVAGAADAQPIGLAHDAGTASSDARIEEVADDAATGPATDAALDAATGPEVIVPAWTRRGHGDGFTFQASIGPTAASATTPFELVLELDDLETALIEAAAAGTLRLRVSAEYYRDHAVVHTSDHPVDAAGRIVVPLALTQAGKHHVRLELRDADRRVDRATFDLLVGR